jgi:hypothetical protein
LGIADPKLQGGAAALTTLNARLSASGAGSVIEPAPAAGFSGAAALDGQGRLAGMSIFKPSVVAGPALAAAQAEFVPVERIKTFLAARGVALAQSGASGVEAAKAAVRRVICVRK